MGRPDKIKEVFMIRFLRRLRRNLRRIFFDPHPNEKERW